MKVLTPIKAIRAKGLDCTNDQVKEIRLCPIVECALWPYRMGKRPTRESQEVLFNDDQIEVRCRGVNEGLNLGGFRLGYRVELCFRFPETVSIGRYHVPTCVKASVRRRENPDSADEVIDGYVDLSEVYGHIVGDFLLVTRNGTARGSFDANLPDGWEPPPVMRARNK